MHGVDLGALPMGRAINLYLAMIREWADAKTLDKIEAALTPPASWRDPITGMPAGWGDDEATWAQWESSMR